MTRPANKAPASDAITATVKTAELRRAFLAVDKNREKPYGARVIPILNCITLEHAGGGKLSVAHYGIEMAVSVMIEAEAIKGAACLPATALRAFLDAAESEFTDIKKEAGDSFLSLTCGDLSAKIIPGSTADTPTPPALNSNSDSAGRVALVEGGAEYLIGFAQNFTSTEETRYYLNGVSIEIDHEGDGKVRAVATTGHMLGTREQTLPTKPNAAATFIIPRLACNAIAALCRQKETSIAYDATACRAQIVAGDVTIWTKLIDGTFPDWRRVVPRDPGKGRMTLDSAKLRKLAKAAGLFRRSMYHEVGAKIEPEGDKLRVSLSSAYDPGQITARIGSHEGNLPERLDLNPHYLAGIARALDSKAVELEVVSAGDPIRVRSSITPRAHGELCVIMPMRF